jgi:hypothetical protein
MRQPALPPTPSGGPLLALPSGLDLPARYALGERLLRESTRELARLRVTRGAGRRTAARVKRALAVLALAASLLGIPLAGTAAATPQFVSPIHNFGLGAVAGSSTPALGDLDGDGDLDALVGESGGTLVFFRNTGTASAPAFAAGVTNPFGLTAGGYYLNRSAPALADLDGDGDLDVLVGVSGGNLVFFRNTGTASAPAFATGLTNPFGLAGVGSRSAPALADLDGDGDLDVLVGEYYGNFVFFRNTGTNSAPAFAAPVTNPFGLAAVGYFGRPALADLDGDGDLDALVGEAGGTLIVFQNTGTKSVPAFAAPVTNPFGLAAVGPGSAPALADLDGDGDLDALVGDLGGTLTFFANAGSAIAPAFVAPAPNPFGLAGVGSASIPALGDLDGDGDLDALVGEAGGNLIFFQNTGTAGAPAFATGLTNPFGLAGVGGRSAPALADLDGDGDLDALVGEHYGTLVFFRNTGTAGAPAFAAPVTNPFGLAAVGLNSTPTLADLDGDGDLDALVGQYDGSFLFFRNTGTKSVPAFAAPVTNPFGLAAVVYNSTAALADLDGDGDLDALVGEVYGNLIFHANTGTASAPAFAAGVANPFGLADVGGRSAPALADLDGDGDLDALVGEIAGRAFFFENAPAPPPTTTTTTPVTTTTTTTTLTADPCALPGLAEVRCRLQRAAARQFCGGAPLGRGLTRTGRRGLSAAIHLVDQANATQKVGKRRRLLGRASQRLAAIVKRARTQARTHAITQGCADEIATALQEVRTLLARCRQTGCR